MSLNEYFTELTKKLKRLAEDERREALAFYEEYASEAGIDNGDEMRKRFGSPRELAAVIYAEAAAKEINPDSEKKENSGRGFLIGLAALMCFPLSASAVIALVSVGFALLVSVGSIFFSLIVSGAAIAISGVWALIHGFTYISPFQPGALLMSLGSFLVLTPLGCAFFALMIWVTKKVIDRMTLFITKYIRRRSCHEA